MAYLGLDTSNYTTSAALFLPETNEMIGQKQLLPVKPGEKGLRQSDAVFHHTVQLPLLLEKLFGNGSKHLKAVCASVAPCGDEGSYMPCFLVGTAAARAIAAANAIPYYTATHQQGHIAAVLFGANRLDLLSRRFLAFHVSGGTTQALLVEPDETELFRCTCVARSLDLKAGQAIDRVGLMLNLSFPCGPALDALSQKSTRTFRTHPVLRGADCSLSGLENQCKKMIDSGEAPEDTAKYCLSFLCATLDRMTQSLLEQYGDLPLVFAGGVMSNSLISAFFREKYAAVFAPSAFSADNAAGTALLGYLKDQRSTSCQLF